jgi:hypothetical protein
MKLGDFLTAINYSKESLFDGDDLAEKEYVPFIINRCLSYFPDTIFYSNEMNRLNQIEKRLHFDYLRFSVRKRKRFSKWFKEEKYKDLELIKKVYGYSNKKAKDILSIISEEDIQKIRDMIPENF